MELAISVLVTTQDKATYLDLTLAALENQVLPAEIWEVVVWDDRSNDATSAILDKYEERALLNLVRRRSEERLGSVAARNLSLEIARAVSSYSWQTIISFLKIFWSTISSIIGTYVRSSLGTSIAAFILICMLSPNQRSQDVVPFLL